MSFGIRNVSNVSKALNEIHRVLKSKGKLIILEFSIPQNKVIQSIYLLYFRHILPKVGGYISGDKTAYHYLNTSVEDFPYGKKMMRLIVNSGFTNAKCQPLTFGIASLYIAQKT
jgi:demethylmenaquinone methyltransferase/2-methoxy-6-polyprenyl-1,4-benzoquinol methylase